MISTQIGKLLKGEEIGNKGRKRGKKEEKGRKKGEKRRKGRKKDRKYRYGGPKKGNGKQKKMILSLRFWTAFSNRAWEGFQNL